ncbi:MAG: radical SAM family heme chaperone HemW [Clostridia bacterium]|nr:radical SAM family heme chaperone HemW [Clostridia bacterium]
MLGIYVHIPFCESKCAYCAFSSFVRGEEEREKYIAKLIDEINSYSGETEIDTIYIGGGTPSVLSINLMEKLIGVIKDKFSLAENYEFTIEANPCSLTEEKLACYKKNGVNRLSIGVQSLNDTQLKFIGRRHNSEGAISAITLAKKYINNLSCDLLIGLKDMDKNEFCGQITMLANLGVEHISAYMLQVENGTPLAKMVADNPLLLPDDDQCVEAYDEIVKSLDKLGFHRYELSNFAKTGKESRHNYKYWTGEDYIGFGLGAHSYANGKRWANSSNFEDYYAGKLASEEILTEEQQLEEHIMLGLRCKAGISKKFLIQKGYDIQKSDSYIDFLEKDILQESGDNVKLNPKFYGVSNYIIVKLLP